MKHEDIQRIKDVITKRHSLKEGIIDYIFGKVLVSKLKSDSDFVAMAKKLDGDMQKLRDKVADMQKNGKPIPSSYKKILNIE